MSYNKFYQSNDNFIPSQIQNLMDELPAGIYKTHETMNGDIYFEVLPSVTQDEVVDIPSKEFKQIVGDMNHFLKPETRKIFDDMGFLYKRSFLLYGVPGTGKTVLVGRTIKSVIKNGGVVLYDPKPSLLEDIFNQLNQIEF